jgi:hypothetical protein
LLLPIAVYARRSSWRVGCCAALLAASSSLGTGTARAQATAGSFAVLVTITKSRLNLAPLTVPAGSVVF